MNIQGLMAQAQKMQRELKKAHDELAKEEFSVSKSGAVTVVVMGDKTVKEIKIEEEALDKENREMLQDLIVLALNEVLANIARAEEDINERITGRSGGLGF